MSSAAVVRETGYFALNKFGSGVKWRKMLVFSNEPFQTSGVLATKAEFFDMEEIELRAADNSQWDDSQCFLFITSPSFLDEDITSGDPTVVKNPSSVGLVFTLSVGDLTESALISHTGTVTSNTLVFTVPNITETVFDWVLSPNKLRLASGAFIDGGDSYVFAPDTPIIGTTQITVTGISEPDGPLTFSSVGVDLGIIDEYDGITNPINPGFPVDINFKYRIGTFDEVAY